jgi:uncharacterized protein YwqG
MPIEQLLKKYRLQGISSAIRELLLPGFHVSKAPGANSPLGTSRFGGVPDVGASFAWPYWSERPLSFIAQVNCRDLDTSGMRVRLTQAGIIYFFYDLEDKPGGYAPEHQGGAMILYEAKDTELSRWQMPKGGNDLNLRQYNLRFRAIDTIPHTDSDCFEQLSLTEDEWDRYLDFYDALRAENTRKEPTHQLFGHPRIIQHDMGLECQLASNGIDCGHSSGYADPRAKALEDGVADWMLLFQIDSDDELAEIWHDAGLLYYWTRRSMLKCNDFSGAWAILQSG